MLLCQFLVLAGNRQFFSCGGKNLLRPEKKVLVVCLASCAVVSVFGSGRKLVLVVHTTMYLKYHTVVFCCGGKVLLRPEKKVLVICLASCAMVAVFGSGRK